VSAPLTSGHLCSGYDGLGMALDLAVPQGHRALWHAEIDEDASATLAKHEPGVRNVGDLVQLVLDDKWRLAPRPDVVTAGFPCQPVSAAGRQLAELDHRWLWPFILRILQTVRPPAVFLENVQNIVSIQGAAILRGILDDLQAAGYEARWTILGACAVGAPHHRHRWFLLARYVGPSAARAVRVGAKTFCGAPRSGGRQLLPTPDASEATRGGFLSPAAALRRIADPNRSSNLQDVIASLMPTPTARDGVSDAGYSDTAEGSPNLRTVATLLPTPTVRDSTPCGEGTQEFWDTRNKAMPLGAAATLLPTPRASDGPDGGPGQRNGRGEYDSLPGLTVNLLPTPTVGDSRNSRNATAGRSEGRPGNGQWTLSDVTHVWPERWGRYAEAVALWESITGTPAPAPTELGAKGGRRMSPLLPEWMMGLPTGHLTGHLGRSAAIKQAGNGVVPLQAAAAWRLLAAG
jgi:DNA (cytosine-5)-methyltransferase 1